MSNELPKVSLCFTRIWDHAPLRPEGKSTGYLPYKVVWTVIGTLTELTTAFSAYVLFKSVILKNERSKIFWGCVFAGSAFIQSKCVDKINARDLANAAAQQPPATEPTSNPVPPSPNASKREGKPRKKKTSQPLHSASPSSRNTQTPSAPNANPLSIPTPPPSQPSRDNNPSSDSDSKRSSATPPQPARQPTFAASLLDDLDAPVNTSPDESLHSLPPSSGVPPQAPLPAHSSPQADPQKHWTPTQVLKVIEIGSHLGAPMTKKASAFVSLFNSAQTAAQLTHPNQPHSSSTSNATPPPTAAPQPTSTRATRASSVTPPTASPQRPDDMMTAQETLTAIEEGRLSMTFSFIKSDVPLTREGKLKILQALAKKGELPSRSSVLPPVSRVEPPVAVPLKPTVTLRVPTKEELAAKWLSDERTKRYVNQNTATSTSEIIVTMLNGSTPQALLEMGASIFYTNSPKEHGKHLLTYGERERVGLFTVLKELMQSPTSQT